MQARKHLIALQSMKSLFSLLIIGVAMLMACTPKETLPPTAEEQQLIDIAGENYEDLIRLPIGPNGDVDTSFLAKIVFESEEINFDTVTSDTVLEYQYEFTNKGLKNLVILDVRSSCGCTIPSYSEDPIPPGRTGTIDIRYDTKDLNGLQEKIIRVYSNTYPNESLLKLKGFVISQTANNI